MDELRIYFAKWKKLDIMATGCISPYI
jgi:hypothetical protein